MEVFSLGETWVVDGLWEFTITSATKHYACNHYNDHTGPVVAITYTYKNLGYQNYNGDGLLSIWGPDFEVYDKNGVTGDTYPCTHVYSHDAVRPGMTCNAGTGIAVSSEGGKITIIVSVDTRQCFPYSSYLHAKFEIDVS